MKCTCIEKLKTNKDKVKNNLCLAEKLKVDKFILKF